MLNVVSVVHLLAESLKSFTIIMLNFSQGLSLGQGTMG